MNDVEVRGFPEYFTRYVEQTQKNSIEEYGDFTGSGKPATPVAIPDCGEVEKGTEIFLSCKTKGANIYYTTDGSIPTSASSLYHKGIKINKDTTIRAIAIKESDILNVSYTIAKEKPQAPTASPNGGVYPEGTLIVLSCETPDSTIYYTTDGSTPTENSLEYIEPIILEEDITLKAIAYKEGVKSNITSVNFVATKDRPATPIITPNAGMVEVGTNVSLSCFTQDAIIYYTTDGSTPTEDSYEYISEITLEEDTIIKAVAIKNNRRSEVLTAMFIVIEKPEMPIAIPNGGAVEEGSVVLLSCSTPDTIIYYTTDGSTPTTSSTEYVDGITINEDMTIKAIAAKFDICSNVSSFSFIALERPEMPTASPNGGRIKAETPITLSCETPNTTIYYTLDGSEPTIESTEYIEPITFDEDTTIKAISVRGGIKSFVMSVDFEIKEKPVMPVISPNGGTVINDIPISLSCSTPESIIYYTTDGSDPTENSTEYVEPFTLSENSTIKAIAYKEDVESDITSASFIVKARPAAPTISPNGGTVINDTPVSLSCATTGVTIYYTTDGTVPTSSSTEYTEPFTLNENSTVKAISVKENIESADITSASFIVKIRPETPTASQPEGNIPFNSTVTLSCATTGVTIYYTTDGSEPTSSSTEYTQAIEISADTTLKAIAIKDDLESEILTVSYTVFTQLTFNELSDWLAAQDENTAETPYKLGITGLTEEDLNINMDTGNPSALDMALMSNPIKYVDLSPTTIPSSVSGLMGTFMQCSTIVKSPTIPDGVVNLMGVFYLSTSLKEATFNISDFSNVDVSVMFNGCTALEDVYVPSMDAKNSLLSKLTPEQDYPSTLDMNEIIKAKDLITCSFDELSETLQDLNNNTAAEPYSVIVTNLASEDLGSSSIENTIGNVLQTNNRKFVALANIELPQETTSLSETFENCSTLVSLDSDLSNVTDLNETFSGCTSLRKVPAIPSGADTLTSTFSGCTSLTEVKLNIEDYSEVETSGMLAGCTALETVYVPSPEAATSLTSKLVEGEDYPSSLDIDEITVAGVDVEELDTFLQSLSENTIETPYKIKVINIKTSNQNLISDALHNNDTKYVDLSETELPSGLTNMSNMFNECTSLVKAPIIPNGVTDLSYAFSDCSSLIEAPIIPNGVIAMESTFYNCVSLTTAPVIPSNVTNLISTFSGCTSLTTAPAIPSSVEYMNYTFSGCTSLTTAPAIPSAVTDLSEAFSGCTGLIDVSNITIPSGITSLQSMFSGCTSLTTAPEIPSGVTNLEYTFQNCTSLTNIVSNIVDYSSTTVYNIFENCTALQNIYVPCQTAKTTLESKLGSSEFPETLDPNEVIKIKKDIVSFDNLNTYLQNKSANTAQVPYIINVTDLTAADLGSSSALGTLGYILNQNSAKYVDLSETELPSGLTNMSNTFNGCTSLVKVPEIPDSVTNMESTFSGCTNVTVTLEIPSNVTNLTNTFSGCTGLVRVLLKEEDFTNVTVNDQTFFNCDELQNIYVVSETAKNTLTTKLNSSELSDKIVAVNVVEFSNLNNYLQGLNENTTQTPYVIRVTGLTEADCDSSDDEGTLGYILNQNSTKYVDLNPTELPDVSYLDYSFFRCSSIVKAPTISNETISFYNTFHYCTSLIKAPKIPNKNVNLTQIFYNCTSLTDVSDLVICDGQTGMDSMFTNCTSLTDISGLIIPSTVTSFGQTFSGCTGLTAVTIMVESYPTLFQTFKNCTSLQSIYVPTAAARTSLISKLNSNNFPTTLDKNTVVKVKDQSVVIK